jgi:hypothetical protein
VGRLELSRLDYISAAAHFAAASAGDPGHTVATSNVDVALAAAVKRLSIFAAVIGFVPGIGTAVNRGSEAIETGLVTLALLALVIGWQAVRLRWALRGVLRRYVRELPMRNRALTVAGLLMLAALSALVLMCVVPPGPARVVLLVMAASTVLTCWIALAVRADRLT